nr:flippase activity-associated protein Agl23 [uncultured Methanoregula sp.]
MQQAAFFTPKLKKIFSFERIFFLILITAIIIRFWQLDLKLLHHDEAIHSWFSYELLTKGTWMYDPSYHGPFLYYVTAGMFSVFGDSDFTARLLPALFGVLLIPLVYCIYRLGYINKTQTLVAALFIALSPDLVFFSRFLRHDIFMLFFTLMLLVALLYYFERGHTRYIIIAAIAAAGSLACKEEMPVILLIFATFFIYAIWKGRLVLPSHWKHDFILAFLTLVAILAILYSGFGVHPETLQSGWLEAIRHWTDMHNQQRLGGPWFFYVPLFLLYELPIFILAVVGIIQFMIMDIRPSSKLLQVKNWMQTRSSRLTTAQLAETTIRQLKEKHEGFSKSDEFFRFCIYWMILTMAFYAYVGEKVPWLIIHQLVPMCFVAVYKLNWQKTLVAIVGCLFLVMMTWHVAFIPADINEPIIQVQNSEDMRTVMHLIDASDHVVVASKDYWPLPWYYRGDRWDKISFYGNLIDETTLTQNNPGVIILHDAESLPSIKGYDKTTYKLSYWFSVYDNVDRMIDYYLHRDGKMGSINIDVFTRNTSV